MKATKIARIGEQLVFDTLPQAKWINGEVETRDPYDIYWQGIKIDVKTTMRNIGSGFSFSAGQYKDDTNTVIVLVAIKNGDTFFWLDKPNRVLSFYKSPKTALTREQLPQAIKSFLTKQNTL